MATLKRESDGHEQLLVHDALAGRDPEALVFLSSPRASFRHAAFHWTGLRWEARDLGSRNGTRVDGEPAAPGAPVGLRRDAVITLGDDAERWILVDDAAPVPAARNLASGAVVVAEDGYLHLPSADDPVLTVHDHPTIGWLVEAEDGTVDAVQHGQVLAHGGDAWKLHLAQLSGTLTSGDRPRLLHGCTLRFTVSSDEEHVDVEAVWPDEVRLLPPSVHWYAILLLARARLSDARDGTVPEREHGWVHRDDLCRDLRVTRRKLNVDLYRLRRMLTRAGIADGTTLLEQRPTSGHIRLGIGRIAIP